MTGPSPPLSPSLLEEELRLQHEALQQAYQELGQSNEELQAANEELRQARDRYASLYDRAPVGYVTLDDEGVMLEANQRFTDLLGAEPPAVVGLPFAKLIDPQDQDRLFLQRRQLQGGKPCPALELRLRPSGEATRWVRSDWLVEPPHRLRIALSDITEHKAAEARLLQAERMASLGLLAAGVAHEINNPLTYVLYNLGLLAERLSDLASPSASAPADAPGRFEELVDEVQSALLGARTIRDIVKHLRVFSHVDEDQFQPVAVNDVLDTAIELGSITIRYRARVVKRYSDLPPVLGNARQLTQVFLNLIANAAHAIEEGRVRENEIRVLSRVEDGEVTIEVADTGSGMDPETLARVFDPFFTTKDVGSGSGLGLSVCTKIVANHGGQISAESAPGTGSRFIVRLPAQAAISVPPPTVRGTEPTPMSIPERARILVVDDEPQVAKVIARTLRPHEVMVADSGRAARDLISGGERFDAIVCDLMMPDLTGMDLRAWLALAHADQARRMIFLTGGAFTPAAQSFLANVNNQWLEKPFDQAELLAAVARVLTAELLH